MQENSHR